MKSNENENLLKSGFFRLPQILELIPVSEATWWNGCRDGKFPKPYKLSARVTAWKKDDIFKTLDSFKPMQN